MRKEDYNSKILKFLTIASLMIVGIYVVSVFDLIPNTSGAKDSAEINLSELEGMDGVNTDQNSPTKGMYGVTSSNQITSEIGMKVLQAGGNAVDAAVAMSYSLGVTDPQNSGIGGAGGMLVYDAKTEESVFYDYYFAAGNDEGNRFNIAIPGFVKGMEKVNEDLGTREMDELIQYSVDLAEEGITITQDYADNLNRNAYIKEVHPSFNDFETIESGMVMTYPELAETMKKIQAEGSSAFYSRNSEIAQNFMELTETQPDTLENYEVIIKEPIKSNYQGYDIIAPPPPFSGLLVAQTLKLDEMYDFPDVDYTSEEYWDTVIREDRVMSRERRQNIVDGYDPNADFSEYLQEDYLANIWADFDGIDTDADPETENTTAFSVIDKDGLVVSGTNTLSNYWGSYQIRDGIVYNNSMKNFTYGKNKTKELRRPRTGIAQSIIINDDYLETIGSSGGKAIPNILSNLTINNKKRNINLQEANELKRTKIVEGIVFLEGDAEEYDLTEFVLQEPVDFWSSDTGFWGRASGIVIEGDNISGHTDDRDYLVPSFIYYDGTEIKSN